MFVDSQLSKEEYYILIKDIDKTLKPLNLDAEEYKSILNKDLNSEVLLELKSIRTSNFDLSTLDRVLVTRFIKYIEINENGTAKIHLWLPQLSLL